MIKERRKKNSIYIKKKRRRKLLEDKRLNFFSVKIYLLPVKNLNF